MNPVCRYRRAFKSAVYWVLHVRVNVHKYLLVYPQFSAIMRKMLITIKWYMKTSMDGWVEGGHVLLHEEREHSNGAKFFTHSTREVALL